MKHRNEMTDALKLLLVEDDPGVRDGLADVLSEVAPVRVSSTVANALSHLSSEKFGLVFADLHIGREPGGAQILREAKKHQVPVIICTGVSRREAEVLLGDLKADAILTKPFSIDDVLTTATRLFKK